MVGTVMRHARAMKCPYCQTAMKPRMFGQVELDECPGCQASWCELGELDSIGDRKASASLEARFRADTFPTKMICPACKADTLTSGTVNELSVLRCCDCRGLCLPLATVDGGVPRTISQEIAAEGLESLIRAVFGML